jgi:hypothetical protein
VPVEYDKAIADYQDAIRFDPESADAFIPFDSIPIALRFALAETATINKYRRLSASSDLDPCLLPEGV